VRSISTTPAVTLGCESGTDRPPSTGFVEERARLGSRITFAVGVSGKSAAVGADVTGNPGGTSRILVVRG
jgi:hypothetical protein